MKSGREKATTGRALDIDRHSPLPPGTSTGMVSLLAVLFIMLMAALQDRPDREDHTGEFDFIQAYFITAIIICILLIVEIFNQLPFLKEFYIVVQVVAVVSLLWPNIMFVSVQWTTFSTPLHFGAIRCRSIVRYWCVINLLSYLDGSYWRQSTVVARVCYGNMLYSLLQINPDFLGSRTKAFNVVYYTILWLYVLYECIRYYYRAYTYSQSNEEKSKQRVEVSLAAGNIEKQSQMRIETLLTRGFVALLAFSSTLSLVAEVAMVTASQRALSEAMLALVVTCEIFVTTAICSSLVRSELRGVDEYQQTLLSRITLLRGFSSVFRSPFSNIYQGLKLLAKDLRMNIPVDADAAEKENFRVDWIETVTNILGAWRNTLDIFDDMLICEIFEDKAIKLEPEAVPVLSFVQDTSKQLLSQAKEESIAMNVLGGPLTDIDFDGVFFNVDSQKLSSALRAIISNVLASSSKNSEVIITIRKVSVGPAEQKYCDNSGLERIRIEIQNKKMNTEAYSFGENSLFGTSAHFMAATDNDTGLGLWIASSTIREHPNGLIGLEKKPYPTSRKHASFCIYIELPAFYQDPVLDPSATQQVQSVKGPSHNYFDPEALNASLMQLRAFRNRDDAIVGAGSLDNSQDGAIMDSSYDEAGSLTRVEESNHYVVSPPVDISFTPGKVSPHSRSSRNVSDAGSVHDRSFKFNRILIVDDAALVVKMTVRMLKGMNIASEYLSSLSGSEAIQIVEASMGDEKDKIDVVFLDYVMPVVNGPTVAAKIRQLGYTGIIIGVTALIEAADQEVFISNGADIVAVKPLQPLAVQEALSTLVMRKQGERDNS